MTDKEIKDAYESLLYDVANKNFYNIDLTNRVNCYVCECGHITKTKDIDAGVTPFYHQCEECDKFAKSTMYTDILPDKEPTQEWYRPSLKEVLKMKNKIALLDHILNGGLDVRKIQKEKNS